MDRYRVVTTLRLFPGAVVELSPAQALPRESALLHQFSGVFEVHRPVQFKAGEELGIADAPKALLGSVLQPLEAAGPGADTAAAAPAPKTARKRTGG